MGRQTSHQLQLLKVVVLLSLIISTPSSLLRSAPAAVVAARTVLVEEAPKSYSHVKALFVFGDSVLDAGTNNHFASLFQADIKPYGQQLFGKPTGRWTNGRTYADFIAEYTGLPYVDPYLERTSKGNIEMGVNYASGGSGLLQTTNAAYKVVPYPEQILQFGVTRAQIQQKLKTAEAAFDLFSDSLFFFNIGVNDLLMYELVQPEISPEKYIENLIEILKDSIETLYQAGARKMVFLGVGAFGCVPGILAAFEVTDGACVDVVNDIVQAYNTALGQLVRELPKTFKNLQAVFGKPYDLFLQFATKGEQYGFTAGLTACCGAGPYNGAIQCGRPADLITDAPSNLCKNVGEYQYWDQYHATERAFGLMAEQLWNGNTSFIEPYNIKALVSS